MFNNMITEEVFYTSKALVKAMFCGTSFKSQNALDEIYMLLHSEESSLEKIMSINYNEITRPIFAITLAIHYPHFTILSLDQKHINPFCAPLNQYYKMYGGSVKDKYFLYKFFHELTHAILYAVFQNDSKPYPKHELGAISDEYEAYTNAKNEFFQNVFKELKVKKDEIDRYNKAEYVLSDNMYLNIYGYCYIEGSNKHNILTIALNKYAANNWPIHDLFDSDIIDLSKKKMGGNQTLKTLIDIEGYITKEYKETSKYTTLFLETIMSRFNISVKDSESLIIEYSKIKNELKKGLEHFCSKQTYDSDYIMFMNRLFDYSKRSSEKWDSELLPRFVEVYVNQDENEKVKQLYEPLAKYWKDFVIPATDQIINADYAYSQNVFMKEEKGLLSYLFSILFPHSDSEPLHQSIGEVLA